VTRERGSVTVVTAAVIALLVVLTMGAADVGHALVARAHAEQAADAAALAAAQELAFSTGQEPSAVAAEYAERNGGTLLACACAVVGAEALVDVSVPVGSLLLLPGARLVTARARAVVDLPASAGPVPTP
jgi:secretion/DNA translocation related TadE-like protein